jgi:D-tyrosyl-tRNA(Tyr) deacylase
MRALLQRVSAASVVVEGEHISEIGHGWLVLLGVGQKDSGAEIKKLVDKIAGLRLFADESGKFNRSVVDVGGSLLIVSQFTLYADTSSGRRPGFSGAAAPEIARRLYEETLSAAAATGLNVKGGKFGADMKVSLVNDGPVTLMLDTEMM